MMHGKSVSHVDVSIRSHHVIRWCFVTRDSEQFFRARECGSEGSSLVSVVWITTTIIVPRRYIIDLLYHSTFIYHHSPLVLVII